MKKYTIRELYDKKLIIFSAVMGSHAYGTAMPTSDVDLRGVFIQPIEDILGFGYIDQVADKTNDIVFYEIKRFLELVQSNNPNILELLNVPEDCIKFKDPIFDLILEQKDQFITKQCKNSFVGYAIQQIKKARGYNKKINWEEKEMVRKGVLDFCYILKDGGTITLNEFFDFRNTYHSQKTGPEDFGLAKVDHAHNIYAMYDLWEHDIPKGIISERDANDVQLSSIPKGIEIESYLIFNKDAYSVHCKRYKEYQTWLKERNEDRFKMNKEHGKQYDSKNMAHCMRLLTMGLEIANDGNIIVRRPPEHIKYLMKIRKGEMEYDELLNDAESKLKLLDAAFDESSLPNKVDKEFVDNLLITIRKLRYNFSN